MKTEPDNREIKCYLCDSKLFSIRHRYQLFYAFCEKCLKSLEKQEADQVKLLSDSIGKMKDSEHFSHASEL